MASDEINEPQQYPVLPQLAKLVWVRFPHTIGVPGPYPRPALVIAVSREHHAVKVVFGTSQKTDRIYPTEFVVRKTDPDYHLTGLSYDTKFDMSRQVNLPYNSEWFAIPPAREGHPVPTTPELGTLPASYLPAIKKAAYRVK
ncbi:hypothetical protein ABU178_19675 [Pantoea osteomyelitidis]|uniref:Uncharacterized protein n=1 Tax=Pantoea osteomyelitidis TaxID=3230026 RepID=A0ABW7Q185_9GAMM